MSFYKAFSVFALILFFMAFSLEASSNSPIPNKGFVAPFIHITSPEHPFYNSNASPSDLARERVRISEQRERYFHTPNWGTTPINFDMLVTYFIGTPPIKSTALFDTGADMFWQKCKPCQGPRCFGPIFDPAKSSSYQLLPCDSSFCRERYGFECGPKKSSCRFNVKYWDNTTSRGALGMEIIKIMGILFHPGMSMPNIVFGCGNFVTHHVNGIMGFQNTNVSLPNQFVKDPVFSYCKRNLVTGGYLILGPQSALLGFKTPLFTDSNNHYQIIVEGILVDGFKLNVPYYVFKYDSIQSHSGVIIDSGTPFTMLHTLAFGALTDEIDDIMNEYTAHMVNKFWCYNESTGLSIDKMPTIHFLLGNDKKLALPKENVWFHYKRNICLQLLEAAFPFTIFGAQQLNGYNVGYDLPGRSLWLSYEKSCPY